MHFHRTRASTCASRRKSHTGLRRNPLRLGKPCVARKENRPKRAARSVFGIRLFQGGQIPIDKLLKRFFQFSVVRIRFKKLRINAGAILGDNVLVFECCVVPIKSRLSRYAAPRTGAAGAASYNQQPRCLRSLIRSFDKRIEFARIGALLTRAKTRCFSAAKRYVIINARRRQIHHHHPRLRIRFVMLGIFQR